MNKNTGKYLSVKKASNLQISEFAFFILNRKRICKSE
jgi:hypothetical protein